MWKKRACSVLLALMVAMTAIPFSAVPVYSQEAETMQDASDTEAIGEEEVLTQEPAQAAEEAVEEETDTEDVSAAWDAQPQEEEQQQEEDLSSDKAAAEDDQAASEVGQETDAAAEDAEDQEKAIEDGTDTAEESSPEADSDDALPSGQADDTQTPDEETPDEVISEKSVTETVSEDAVAEGEPDENGGRIWFDINENRIFSDGTYSFDLHTEDIPEAYDVQVQVGHYDDNGLVEAYTEGKEYSFDGSKLTLDGQRIFQRGYHWFGMEVQAVSRQDGHILCGNGFGFESWEARAEYDFAEDKEMLTGWYATVNHWERVYVENAGNPKGMDLSYETTNVSIVSQEPVESGREVLEMRIHYPEGDTSSDNYCGITKLSTRAQPSCAWITRILMGTRSLTLLRYT